MSEKVSGVPTPKQQKFILTELIPAILKEQGGWFAMDTWHTSVKEIRIGLTWDYRRCFSFDGIPRFDDAENCNSVRCIGGTAEKLLFGKKSSRGGEVERDIAISKKLGLTYDEVCGLFYHWRFSDGRFAYRWPKDSMKAFESAKTPLEKAQVVAALLIKIATEGGKCLHNE